MMAPIKPQLSVVVIGRNEGERLSRCLRSVQDGTGHLESVELIYVDSYSTDDSVERASELGAHVIDLTPGPLAAARGRNLGWRYASAPAVLFLDGDTVLARDFLSTAMDELVRPRVAVVCGQRREMQPEASVYQRVLDLDWVGPIGDTDSCGGDALIRRDVLVEVGGYEETLIAGEEPEMCARMRQAGFIIHRMDTVMTWHDLAMTSWRQYWRRAVRTGHAYAEVSHRLRFTSTPLWSREARRNAIHATGLLALMLAPLVTAVVLAQSSPLLIWLTPFLLLLRTAHRRARTESMVTRLLYAVHSHVQQLPIFCGQISYWAARLRGGRRSLMEYQRVEVAG